MPEFCTCGAQLPPDALFCHKCGKPQREITAVEAEPPPPVEFVPPTQPIVEAAPQPVRTDPPAPSFHNPAAVRIALLVSIGAMLFSWLPFVNWIAAGFLAAFFYHRRIGRRLRVGNGVQIGWITGVLTFGMSAVVFIAQESPSARSLEVVHRFQTQLQSMPGHDPGLEQMLQFFQTPQGMIVLFIMSLAVLFLIITCLSMAGGALGAKVAGGD
ncbi:MAG TPA: zinc ribbon domain-containing protein [Bryobacteraceae bacterium]|nr:zinc ribbon domain-containing protein [Bryobacteraceae bacterium]